MIRIARTKDIFDSNWIGLCLVIEHQRHEAHNPVLPARFSAYYADGLKNLKEYSKEIVNTNTNKSIQVTALSAIATCSGNVKLGKAILELDDQEVLDEFLGQF